MAKVYDVHGTEVADLPISDNMMLQLIDGHPIAIRYRTPQLRRQSKGDPDHICEVRVTMKNGKPVVEDAVTARAVEALTKL